MALATYSDLKTAVASWLDVSSSDISSVVDDAIAVAEKRIFNEVNHRYLHASLSATISSGVVAIPSDFLNHVDPNWIDNSDTTPYRYPLLVCSSEYIYAHYPYRTTHGKPRYIATEGTNFIFGPYPDQSDYVLKGTYKRKLDPVSTSANTLFANHPELYLYASLLEVSPLIGRDDRLQLWDQKYRLMVVRLNSEDTRTAGQARPHY